MYVQSKTHINGKSIARELKSIYLKGYTANRFKPMERSVYLAEAIGIRTRFADLRTIHTEFDVADRILGIFNYDNNNTFGGYSPEINILVDNQIQKKDIAKTVYYLTGCYLFGESFPRIMNSKNAFFAFKVVDDNWYEGKHYSMDKFAKDFAHTIT